jgi:hypothetical protein
VGPQRLIALLIGVASCAPAPKAAPTPTRAAPVHVQIVHAMKTPARAAIAARFRERNGSEWAVGPAEIEPFRGFVRTARRERGSDEGGDAAGIAFAFVRQNADLLGLHSNQAVALEEHLVREGSRTIVHYAGTFPMRGYASQRMLDTVVDLDLVVEGRVTGVVNRSVIHPVIAVDLRPVLSSDDPRVVAKLVGRRVFALANEAVEERQRTRIPLGEIRSEDFMRVDLLVHVSAGPSLAWMTYRLAYAVDIARPVPTGEPSSFYFFRFVVDADTGDLIEDSKVPIAPMEPFD